MHVFAERPNADERESMRLELVGLAQTAGANVVAQLSQTVSEEHPGTLIGSGKLEELRAEAARLEAGLIIFGVDLTGSQLRNIEDVCGLRVIDRTQLILDIFASRAASFEGKAQVKLAQLSYLLPRLTGRGVAMSRLGGGIGTRGPGETKLETDRRKIRKEIDDLQKVVRAQGRRRSELRRRRKRQGVYSVGIVGYTNAGKTTLLSRLSNRFGERAIEVGSDRLFDTLDLVSRRITFDGRTFVVTDTVGFIRALPHHLVDAFRATLEEAVDADVIVHVADANSPQMDTEMETVYRVLEHDLQVKASVVTLFNEKYSSEREVLLGDPRAAAVVRGSVLDEDVLLTLLQQVDELVGERVRMRVIIPHERPEVLAMAYRLGKVGDPEVRENGLSLALELDRRDASVFLPFTNDEIEENEWR